MLMRGIFHRLYAYIYMLYIYRSCTMEYGPLSTVHVAETCYPIRDVIVAPYEIKVQYK